MLGVDTAVLELRDGAFHLGDAVISLAEIAKQNSQLWVLHVVF